MPSEDSSSSHSKTKAISVSNKNGVRANSGIPKARHGSGGSVKRVYSQSSRSCSVSSSSDSSSESSFTLPTPPDGGWGWVVVFGSFCAMLIADGCAFSFGVLYVELLEYFRESRSKTALVGSLFISVPLITGPVASALTNKYGCRNTTIAGGIIAAIGLVLSSFVSSINMLCFTYGIIAGFGLALVYVPVMVIVAFYFENKRAFATGLAVAGSGIGTFIFAPLIDMLIVEYSWHGALLVLGGIVLNIVLCGLLYRPLVPQKILWARHKQKSRERFSRKSTSSSEESSSSESSPSLPGNIEEAAQDIRITPNLLLEHERAMVTHSLVQIPTYLQTSVNECVCENPDQGSVTFVTNGHTSKADLDQNMGVPDENVDLKTNNANCSGSSKKPKAHMKQKSSAPVNIHCPANGDVPSINPDKNLLEGVDKIQSDKLALWQQKRRSRSKVTDWYLPLYHKDIFYRGSLPRGKPLAVRGPLTKTASCPDVFITNPESSSSDSDDDMPLLKLSKEVKLILYAMLDVSILKSILFVYFCLHSFLLAISYDIPYVYTVEKAIHMGIPEVRASFLVAIIGIVSTFGQVFSGYLGDKPYVNCLYFYSIMTVLAGGVTTLVPLFVNFELLATYSALYGFFISANYALTTIVIVDLFDMERLTNAFGLVSLAEGVANLCGPPIAGLISDATGDFEVSFYLFGAVMLLSGLMLFAIPLLIPYDHLYKTRQLGPGVSFSDSESDSESEEGAPEKNSSLAEPNVRKPKSRPRFFEVEGITPSSDGNINLASSSKQRECLNNGVMQSKLDSVV